MITRQLARPCVLILLVVGGMIMGQASAAEKPWAIGKPIVTYYAGPDMTEATARQMAEGNFNVVWCNRDQLDNVHRNGLRGMLRDGLLAPGVLDDPAQRAQLDALIARVKDHPALYAYYLIDEPNAAQFPEFGKLVAYLREKDPGRLAYINLFPTYASNEQLGNQGDVVTAYRDHLRQFVDVVKPQLISYDHYHFAINGADTGQYYLNLALIREAALAAGVPFLNIVQACTWAPEAMRVPTRDEMRFLVYTTLAYGGQGISYYVYCHPNHIGAIARADGTPTPLYHALKVLNREFVAVASQLQPLRSLGVYQMGMRPAGTVTLPADSPFRLDPPVADRPYQAPEKVKGIMLGAFGQESRATHALVVNLDYLADSRQTLVGPGPLEVFDVRTGQWEASRWGNRVNLYLAPGGGKLVRLQGH